MWIGDLKSNRSRLDGEKGQNVRVSPGHSSAAVVEIDVDLGLCSKLRPVREH